MKTLLPAALLGAMVIAAPAAAQTTLTQPTFCGLDQLTCAPTVPLTTTPQLTGIAPTGTTSLASPTVTATGTIGTTSPGFSSFSATNTSSLTSSSVFPALAASPPTLMAPAAPSPVVNNTGPSWIAPAASVSTTTATTAFAPAPAMDTAVTGNMAPTIANTSNSNLAAMSMGGTAVTNPTIGSSVSGQTP